ALHFLLPMMDFSCAPRRPCEACHTGGAPFASFDAAGYAISSEDSLGVSSRTEQSLVSSSFGDYTLLERLAAGGMAEVFLGKQRGIAGFEKLCAVKLILPEFSANAEFVAMFVNEAKIAARLSHPNIVHIFNFVRIGEHYFIAMEYVHGEHLTHIMDRAITRQLRIPPPLAAM